VAHAVDGQHLVRESKSKSSTAFTRDSDPNRQEYLLEKGAAKQPREKKNCREEVRTMSGKLNQYRAGCASMQISLYGELALV
jgi:hypothetical protein